MVDAKAALYRRTGPSGVQIARPVDLARRPSVSVVVPCYNYGHYLPRCLSSVLSQPGVDVDVILVDDASTDDSAAVARELADADSRIRVVLHPENRGHIATYNDGLRQVEGAYVVLLSADDLLVPGALARATALMEAHPSVGLTYGKALPFEGDVLPPARETAKRWVIWPGRNWLRRRWQTAQNCIWAPESVLRTAVQRQIGAYQADFPHAGDLEMWMRAAAVADVGFVDGADQAFYRFHGTNMHLTTFEGANLSGVLVDLRQRREMFEQLAIRGATDADLPAARRAVSLQALKAVARSSDLDGSLVGELMGFALDADPGARGSFWWRAAEATRSHPGRSWLSGNPQLLAQIAIFGGRDRVRRLHWEAVGG